MGGWVKHSRGRGEKVVDQKIKRKDYIVKSKKAGTVLDLCHLQTPTGVVENGNFIPDSNPYAT
jgi:hypothetical protein